MMKGGEIFIPKIKSIKIIDVAKYLAPKRKIKIVGLRPGEKIHEILISKNESQNVNEFKKFYIIKPTIIFNKPKNYEIYNSEKCKKVGRNFEYDSCNNKELLSYNTLYKYIKK
jgi:UDP-N-acetylglucosamine 4,6-dehydratase